ncbi:8-amino-7-oxononanoate synthase [compost metagenome]
MAKLDGRDQEPVVVWCSNDYLGMSQHPIVREKMHEALEAYGAGSGGSRNIGGSHEVYARLEASLADWHGKDAALVFPTGFGSNDATIQCLLRRIPDCVVISDELNHLSDRGDVSIHQVHRFEHHDLGVAQRIAGEDLLQMPDIVVAEDLPRVRRRADAIDNRGIHRRRCDFWLGAQGAAGQSPGTTQGAR